VFYTSEKSISPKKEAVVKQDEKKEKEEKNGLSVWYN